MTLTPPASPVLPAVLPAVRLRVPTEEDAYAWYDAFKNPEVMEFHGGRPHGVSVYEELTARQRKHDAELGFCLWTLLDENDTVIGFTGAQPWPHQHFGPVGEIEIGWRLGRDHWGRGYATAAAQATLLRLRAAGVREVSAMVDARNARSLAVCERLGMRREEAFVVPRSEPERRGYCFKLSL
ncbi:GNAT family N-acetyltransferase [Streptomyces sp. CA-294286]|uniref:GNAT family N-acetyltransferase n=1 Tax=Streptomyces sp. CA-294286 TaxID=3240070 RepID=UPI003D8A8FA6